MKYGLILAACAALAQSPEAELALGKALKQEILREARPISAPVASAYLQKLTSTISSGYSVDIADVDGRDPIGLPGKIIVVPLKCFRYCKDAACVASKLAHTIGHLELRHGVNGRVFLGGPYGIHEDLTRVRPVPHAVRREQEQFEREADEFAAKVLASLPGLDEAAFQAARAEAQQL